MSLILKFVLKNSLLMRKAVYVGTPLALLAIVGILVPSNVAHAWTGIEGCTPGYWKNNDDKNPRIAELDGITLKNALFVITGINLDFIPASLTLEDAVELNGGGNNAFMRHAAAAVYNIWFGYDDVNNQPLIDYLEPDEEFKDIIQLAADGKIWQAKDLLDDANNLGCPIDAFGRQK